MMARYKKRSGTTGIHGFLYNSHLASLILSRNLNQESEFVLGYNVDEIGVMSEICVRFLHKDNKEKPVAVFIKTVYAESVTDKLLDNPKSALSLYKCYQSYILIKEKFKTDPNALFEGIFDNIIPYFVIYTPNQSHIKRKVVVSIDDKIYTDKVSSIISSGNNNKIFKVQNESLVTDLINASIELIGKTIAAYVTSDVKDRREVNQEMTNVLVKYRSILIPHVIKINEQEENCNGQFNESLHNDNSNGHIKLLKRILFTEILKKSKVTDDEANANIQSLLETNRYTADLLSKLVGTVITFDEYKNKLVYMPGVSDVIKQKSLNAIQVAKSIVDEAFVIAGRKALKRIKINFNDLDIREIIKKQVDESEQNNFKSVFKDEKQIAEQFLSHLYVFAEQGTENDVGQRLKEEIIKNQATNRNTTVFQNKPEAVHVKFFYKVQQWMLLMDESHYLTNTCDFLEDITNIADPHLGILNNNCIMELRGHPLKFYSESFNLLSKLDDTQPRINIITNNVLLTSIKLVQYFSDKSCLYVNFDHVCNMKDIEFTALLKELSKATGKTLVVIIYETMKHTTNSDKFKQIVKSFTENVFAVSKYHIEDFEIFYDTIRGLEDIDNADELLKHDITVQGEKVKLGKIIDDKSINLINAGILYKIIKNESIEIGQNLSEAGYNEIKDSFIGRQLCEHTSSCDDWLNHMRVNDIQSDPYTVNGEHYLLEHNSFNYFYKVPVVVILGEPGMGKSTLLTHMSVKMKHAFPKRWIVKINLKKYCEDFYKWDREGTDVDIIKSMHLVCRAELNNKAFDKLFTLEMGTDGDLVLKESKDLDPIATLHLKLIIHCFNSGFITFLFDGFDEFCPHYEKVIVQFIKKIVNVDNLVDDKNKYRASATLTPQINHNQVGTTNSLADISKEVANKNQIWITSRQYNEIETTLENEFMIKPLYLTRLSINEQFEFYEKYWETRLKLKELNSDQFQNVESFFEYIDQYRLLDDMFSERPTISTNMLLCRMQEAAVKFLRSEVESSVDSSIDKETLLDKWISLDKMFIANHSLHVGEGYLDEVQLTGTPLHMKIHADMFVNEIKDTKSPKIWNMGVHTFEFYNRFLEIKLKKIRFEEKCGENIHTSAFLTEYEDWLAQVTEEHKKLAFYAFFHDVPSHYKNVLPDAEWIKIQSIIERIKKAEEKTGLIDRIDNFTEVPRFVHIVFAEYYAVEYIADLLKKNPLTDDHAHRQIDFVVNCLFKNSAGTIKAFEHKLENDKELREALDKKYTKKSIFTVWMEQDITQKTHKQISGDNSLIPNTDSYLQNILRYGYIEIAWLLLRSIKDTLNSANIERFVDSIGNDFFEFGLEYEDLIIYTLDNIRRVDPSMINRALLNCDLQLGDLPDNDLILSEMRNKDKYPRTVVIPSTDTASGDKFYSIGWIPRWK